MTNLIGRLRNETRSKSNYRRLHCTIAQALSVFGDQWTLLILRDVLSGLGRYEEIQRSLGLSRNLLALRLRDLDEQGLLRREAISGTRRFTYTPTEQCLDLRVTILALAEWGDRWRPDPDGPRLTITEQGTGAPVTLGFIRKHDKIAVDIDAVAVKRRIKG